MSKTEELIKAETIITGHVNADLIALQQLLLPVNSTREQLLFFPEVRKKTSVIFIWKVQLISLI